MSEVYIYIYDYLTFIILLYYINIVNFIKSFDYRHFTIIFV